MVFLRCRRLRWSQVGDIIGVLGGKPDKIETRWLGELDLEDLPRVLGGSWLVCEGCPTLFGGSRPVSQGCPTRLGGSRPVSEGCPTRFGGPVGRES
jgi:hypothetical protein